MRAQFLTAKCLYDAELRQHLSMSHATHELIFSGTQLQKTFTSTSVILGQINLFGHELIISNILLETWNPSLK